MSAGEVVRVELTVAERAFSRLAAETAAEMERTLQAYRRDRTEELLEMLRARGVEMAPTSSFRTEIDRRSQAVSAVLILPTSPGPLTRGRE